MKKWLYLCTLYLFIPLIGQTPDALYTQLAKRPGFEGMSLIEIAADRKEYGDLTHFLIYETDLDALKRTANLLQVRGDFLQNDVKRLRSLFAQASDKAGARQKINAEQEEIKHIERIHGNVTDRIKSLERRRRATS